MSDCIIPVSQLRKLRHCQFSNSSSEQSCLLQKTVGQPAYTVHILAPDLNCIFEMPGMSSSMWMLKSSKTLVFAAEKEDENPSVKLFSDCGKLAQSQMTVFMGWGSTELHGTSSI